MNSSWDFIREDFLSSNIALTADGRFGNIFWDESTGSVARIQSIASAGVSGIARMDFVTPTINTSSLLGSNGVNSTERSLNPVFETRVIATNSLDHRVIAGFANGVANTVINSNTNQMTNEVFFRKQATSTNWEAVTRSTANVTENITTLATACAGGTACTTAVYRTLRIELEDVGANGTARFYIDGTLVATHTTTTVPASATALGYYI
jgi:hypothetical protein